MGVEGVGAVQGHWGVEEVGAVQGQWGVEGVRAYRVSGRRGGRGVQGQWA